MEEDTVRMIAKQHLGFKSEPKCVHVSEGADHDVWLLGSDYVLRILPMSHENTIWLEREAKLSDLLRNHFTHPEFIPENIAIGSLPEHGYVYNVERRIHGVSLEHRKPTEATERDLIEFFRDLAAIPVNLAKDIGISEQPLEQIAEMIDNTYTAWDMLIKFGWCHFSRKYLDKTLDINNVSEDAVASLTPRLLHGDLKGEHIFVDSVTGDLQGIIDWSDSEIGDVAVDIDNLSISVGHGMAHRIGIALGLDNATLERSRLFSQCNTILRLEERLSGEDDSPVWLLIAQFRRAFEGTELEATFDHLTFEKNSLDI